MGQKFSQDELKVYAGQIEHRCQLLIQKRTNEIKINRKKVAKLLGEHSDESARFEAISVQRFERYLVAYRLLTLAGKLIHDQVRVIARATVCPADLIDACSCIIFSRDSFPDIPELEKVTTQLFLKFGEEWVVQFKNNPVLINPALVKALQEVNLSYEETVMYLEAVAKEHNVDWVPRTDPSAEQLGSMKPFGVGGDMTSSKPGVGPDGGTSLNIVPQTPIAVTQLPPMQTDTRDDYNPYGNSTPKTAENPPPSYDEVHPVSPVKAYVPPPQQIQQQQYLDDDAYYPVEHDNNTNNNNDNNYYPTDKGTKSNNNNNNDNYYPVETPGGDDNNYYPTDHQ